MRKIQVSLLVAAAFILGAFTAAFFISETDTRREEFELWLTLSNNQPLLKDCVDKCSDSHQGLLVSENDIALQQLQSLESGDAINPLSRTFFRLSAALLIEFISPSAQPPRSAEIVRSYAKSGCGLSGVICRSPATP